MRRVNIDPAGNLGGLAGAPVLQGRLYIPKLIRTQLPAHKVLLVDFHSSCSAGLLWAETPSQFEVEPFVFHPTQTDRDKKSLQADGSLVAYE